MHIHLEHISSQSKEQLYISTTDGDKNSNRLVNIIIIQCKNIGLQMIYKGNAFSIFVKT